MVTATLKNYRQSPRKVRLVADQVRGKKALVAITELSFTPKRASLPVQKLIASAIANAEHNSGLKAENLVIKEIRVNDGFSMKRFIPKARGMAHPIKKRTCHVEIVLVDGTAPAVDVTATKKVEKKEDKAKKATKPAAKVAEKKKPATKKKATTTTKKTVAAKDNKDKK